MEPSLTYSLAPTDNNERDQYQGTDQNGIQIEFIMTYKPSFHQSSVDSRTIVRSAINKD